jgi:hypothetical protein
MLEKDVVVILMSVRLCGGWTHRMADTAFKMHRHGRHGDNFENLLQHGIQIIVAVAGQHPVGKNWFDLSLNHLGGYKITVFDHHQGLAGLHQCDEAARTGPQPEFSMCAGSQKQTCDILPSAKYWRKSVLA